MIEVDQLSKYFGPVPAVRDVSFQVEEGEIVEFVGPNGAGKTTTLRVLNGFFPPTSGSARIDGLDVFDQSLRIRKRLGHLPENVFLYLAEPPRTQADTWEVGQIIDTLASGTWEREINPIPDNSADFGLYQPEIEVALSVEGKTEPEKVLVGEENPTGTMRFIRVNQEEGR
jgi:ABC-type dipeptide/oligopeptide/nickel transport system ATPase component